MKVRREARVCLPRRRRVRGRMTKGVKRNGKGMAIAEGKGGRLRMKGGERKG